MWPSFQSRYSENLHGLHAVGNEIEKLRSFLSVFRVWWDLGPRSIVLGRATEKGTEL